ncbi:hypothetical protein GDO81_005187 [Engystomops pustulosus]|uniref:Uncharacterized protein n=1 Tax=Engystomops pustulosus TaxID=76066 RepID=A0AAV7CMT3_ENGPU|nr:hypothetical protein GDO81_005187 [Engystomops pustulosus]
MINPLVWSRGHTEERSYRIHSPIMVVCILEVRIINAALVNHRGTMITIIMIRQSIIWVRAVLQYIGLCQFLNSSVALHI